MMSWISRSLQSLTLRRSSITAAAALLTALGAASGNAVVAATLPVPCAPGVCGANRTPGFGQPAGFVTSGTASAVQSGNTLTVTQGTSQAILNWQSFNVSADGRVVFQQPSSTAIALNRIYQNNPSSIFGQLSANGQVYLLNPNGFVFGATSSVNVAGLVASSLGLTDDVFAAGILSPGAATNNPKPAFSSDGRTYVVDSSGNPVLDANGNKQPIQIVVQPGAQMTATGGGRIMLAAQNVTNGGSLSAPDGQIVLAAGQSLYLQGSTDPSMRGLVVEVSGNAPCAPGDPCTGATTNQAGAVLSAPRGNVSLIGMAVNQSGRISATTSVSANGSVILQAANETLNGDGGTNCRTQGSICGNQGGKLEIGATSEIDVLLDTTDTSTAVVGQKQIQSSIQLSGQQVDIAGQITAPGGSLNVVAAANPDAGLVTSGNTAAQIRVAAGTNINLHGSDASLPMSANLQTIQLRGNELEDDPVQRDGPLRGLTAIVDVRNGKPAIISDDSWQSLLQAIPETIAQRTSVGGTASFKSEGDVVVNKGSTIDVSGGKWTYAAGIAQTTQLIGANGRLYDISTADPSLLYTGVLNPTYTVNYNGFGVQVTNPTPGLAHYSTGYVQGFSAGSVTFAAPSMALQGSLVGTAVNGIYQRDASKIPTESLLGLLTGGHGIASGGTLTIGLSTPVTTNSVNGAPDFFSPGVTFANDTAPIVVADGAPLPPQTLLLSPSYMSAGGFAQTQIYSDSTVTLPAGMPLNLGAGGSLQVEAARISIGSDIQALDGVISLVSAETSASQAAGASRLGIDIASGVTLDVRGQWTNDSPLAPGSVVAPTYQNGGSITLGLSAANSPLTSGGELVLGDNVSLRASGGAWIQANNAVVGGTGGNITLDASPYQSALQLGNNVSLDAFGVQGAQGGSFSLSAPRISVAQSDSWASAQRIDDLPAPTGAASATAPGGALNIGSSLFSKYGFSKVSLTATAPVLADASNSDVLTVTSGTTINALTETLQLSPNYLRHGTGGVITGFSQVQTLPEFNRKPVSLSLQVLVPATGVPSSIIFGDLDIQAGATINADPLSKISLLGQGSLLIDGVLRAAGGTILAQIIEPNTSFDPGYLPDQRIELGQQGVLDVSGTTVLQPNTLHLNLGNVLAGGSVDLLARRGDIVADSGSLIDVAGASSPLDVQTIGGSGGYRAATIGSAGGSIQVQSVESISLLGSLSAAAGASSAGTLAGGSLEVDVTPGIFAPGHNVAGSVANPLPPAPATIELVSSAGGSTPTASYGNLAVLSIPQLEQSGIDFLKLQADNTISINSNTPLSLAGSLTLDAPNLSVGYGVNAVLNAPYVMLTDTNTKVTTAAAAVGGTGSLTVNAQQIALSGLVSLQGVGAATLTSTGDVEMQPQLLGAGLTGALALAGDLTISAARIYPATRMSYTITDSAADGHVAFGSTLPPGEAAASLGTPLSVAGSLTVDATNISSSGTILAPFGIISLNATNTLSLSANSVTSVSADGATLLYGQTILGQTEWIYSAGNSTIQLTGVPTRQVTLNAPNVSFAQGATIDVSGGGEISTYEWVPGTGGKVDSLGQANASTAGLYAVMPSMIGQYAAFDLQEFNGSSVTPGASVYLSGVSGLPAGVYPLLPARYALLPGAFLVQVEPGFHSLQTGTIGALSDGTAVTAGYQTFGNTGLQISAGYTGFAVRPGTYSQALAQYQMSNASTFDFAKANPVSTDVPRVVLPADAGTLLIAASNSLSAQGTVKSAAGTGGTAATIELSSSDLTVTATDEAASSGVSISASVLSSWNAGDLILGGQLSADGKSLLVTANNVTIGTGTALQLSAGQIVTLANQSIEVQSGATVASTSGLSGSALKALPDETPLTLMKPDGTVDAGAALLAVSDTSLPIAVRSLDGTTTPVTGGATVKVDSGATLSTRGAVALDAPESVVVNGTINGSGASWSVASNSIAFIPDGAQPAGGPPADSLQINSALLSQMQTAGALRLASAGSIDLQTAVQLGANAASAPTLGSLHLLANSINNESGGATVFGGQTLTLEGTSAATAAPAAGTGTLTFVADTLNVGPGNLAISGNSQTNLRATGAVAGQGTGTLTVGGDVTIAAAEMTAGKTTDSPSNTTIAVPGGTLALVQNGAAAPAASLTSSLGGQLSLTANQIQDSGSIIVPGGRISMTATPGAGGSQATSNINVASNAVIDASGITVSAGDQTVGAAGGIVNLTAAGDLTLAAGSAINVSGAGEAPGGFLSLAGGGTATLGGTLAGNAAADAIGGSFWLDAGQLTGGLASLTGNLTTGGFTNLINVRVQNGNLTSASGSTLTANQITLTADTGVIDIAGTLNAPSAGQRGSIGLFAGNGVTLESTGSLLANGSGASGRGGEIELSTVTGLIDLNGGTISASGQAQMGSLLLRAPAVVQTGDVNIGAFASNVSGVGQIIVEPVLPAYQNTGDFTGNFGQIQTDIANYLALAAGVIPGRFPVAASSGSAPAQTLVLQPGVVIEQTGDLTLGSVLDLYALQLGAPIDLTVRATGNITISGGISDGVYLLPSGSSALSTTASSSLRFVAGADLTSANPLATKAGSPGDLVLTNNALVRTGTGDVDLVAAHNVEIDSGSSAYTTGTPGAASLNVTLGAGQKKPVNFLQNGGDLMVAAGNDVVGFDQTDPQGVSSWQGRGAKGNLGYYGVNLDGYDNDPWTLATFGGGDVNISAGHDVKNVSAAAADSLALSGTTQTHFNSGGLTVNAGQDITSGQFFVADGVGTLSAGRSFAANLGTADAPVGSIFELADSQISLWAQDGMVISGVLNPTVMRQPEGSSATNATFFTYSADSAFNAQSAAGNISMDVSQGSINALLGQWIGSSGQPETWEVNPASLQLSALTGNLNANAVLFPSDNGNLRLFAAQNILGQVSMSDAPDSKIPTAFNGGNEPEVEPIAATGPSSLYGFFADRHAADMTPATITAGQDILGLYLNVPKASRIEAGRDIVGLQFFGQNLHPDDLTLISAGRDFVEPVLYQGVVSTNSPGIVTVGGGGRLDLLAGRDIDLGFSLGVTTVGSLQNPNLGVAHGADITMLAGLGQNPDDSAFLQKIILPSTTYQQQLTTYVESITGETNLAAAQADSEFAAFSADLQRPLINSVFFNELDQSGIAANKPGGGGYTRGYAAIDALFPGSRSGTAGSAANPYSGDLDLTYSQIYAIAGGNITLLAPGGAINVGLATAPSGTGIPKAPSLLGIVAQGYGNVNIYTKGDVNVNSSRIFTLGGGNIVVWSVEGNIDAGNGAKTSLSLPPPTFAVDAFGNPQLVFNAAVAGSGIRTIQTGPDQPAGNVNLIAPVGAVDAGDAGIGAAGNINLAAATVIGAGNINFGGTATGVPPAVSSVTASVPPTAAATQASSSNTMDSLSSGRDQAAPLAQAALNWLDVMVTGLGEENCKPSDDECIKRQKKE